ncbi:MAG: M20/M25/M40 family metallo-hydrolase [Steroidobacteraceae bacterium]
MNRCPTSRQVALASLLLITCAAAVARAPASMPAPALTSPSPPSSPASAIIARALSPSPLAADLERLTDGIGGRVSGTPAMERAVDWALAAFESAGVAAHAETYTLSLTWSEGSTRLEVLGPQAFPVTVVAEGWSAATPPGGIEAPLLAIGGGTEADFARLGSRARGAILLVDSPVVETWADLTNEYDRALPIKQRAVQAGAAAMLWTGARARRLLYRHTDTVTGELSAIPMATLAREDGQRLARLAAMQPALRVRLDMPNRVGPPAPERNVVAEIRGRERPDEVVVLGAHLDSWDLGTGALDNGCNSALVIAAARAIHESGLAPRRTIRFVLFSGEEQGYQGSHAYVLAHRAEMDRTRAALIIDSGVGRIKGFSIAGRDDAVPALEVALRPLQPFDAQHLSLDGELGTDNFDFLLEGVPTLVADQEPANYLENYHAASDTFDKVDLRQLAQHVAIMASAAFAIADHPAPIAPRLSREQIEAQLRRTGLDSEMKISGYWPDWVAGRRGRAMTR